MTRFELRRRNDSMTDSTGKPWSSRSLMQCYEEAAQAFGLVQRSAEPGSMRDGRVADRLGLRQRGLSDPCRRCGRACPAAGRRQRPREAGVSVAMR
jgi:CO/xanthine dehydrogenase Mo-binding subunit